MWDPLLLSESLSVSLTAALAASWLWLLRDPTWPRVALMLATAAAWTLARDPHAYVIALLAVTVAVSLLAGERRRIRAVAAAGLVAIAAAGIVSANADFPRWLYSLQNVVALRAAADPGKLDYFADAGMPVTHRFLVLSRRYRETGEDPFLFPVDPVHPADLQPFQVWLADHGRRTYFRYLLTQPAYVAEAFGDFKRALLFPHVRRYASSSGPWRFPLLPDVLYPRNAWMPLVYLALAVGLALAAFRAAGPRLSWAIPAFLILGSVPFALVSYHGGALEVDRHALLPSLFLRLGTLLLALMALDRLLSRRAGGREPAPG